MMRARCAAGAVRADRKGGPHVVPQQRVLEVFVELADTLVDDFDVIDFLHTLTEYSVELLDADAVGLMLVDQRGNLEVAAASTEETRLLELFEIQNDQGPCLDCFREGRSVTNIDHVEAERRWPLFGAAIREARFSSVHAVPLRLREETIGAMNLFLARPGVLSPEDIALSQGLADIATIGLLQERAIRQQQLLSEQLQGALNSRIAIEQAKGMLAERHGVDMATAFRILRERARRTGVRLASVADGVIGGSLSFDGIELR
jgi:GAF domain-containing protein